MIIGIKLRNLMIMILMCSKHCPSMGRGEDDAMELSFSDGFVWPAGQMTDILCSSVFFISLWFFQVDYVSPSVEVR